MVLITLLQFLQLYCASVVSNDNGDGNKNTDSDDDDDKTKVLSCSKCEHNYRTWSEND